MKKQTNEQNPRVSVIGNSALKEMLTQVLQGEGKQY